MSIHSRLALLAVPFCLWVAGVAPATEGRAVLPKGLSPVHDALEVVPDAAHMACLGLAFAEAKVPAKARRMVVRTVGAMRQNQKLRARLGEITAWSAAR